MPFIIPRNQRRTIPGYQAVMATVFDTVTPNISGFSVRNFFHVTILAPRILKWLSVSWKMFSLLAQMLCIKGDVK